MQRADDVAVDIQRRKLPTFEGLGKILDCRADVAYGIFQVRLEVGAADNALLRLDVDQDERPILKGADLGDDRAAHRNRHRADSDAFEGKFLREVPY